MNDFSLSNVDIAKDLEEFLAVYQSKPFEAGNGGMTSSHMYASWVMLRHIDPEYIIECGIWRGLGTWLIETACPNAKIISLDPNLSKRKFVSDKVTYHYADFSEYDWSGLDVDNTVVFFDDHQDALTRLMQCKWLGFKHVIFEDNYRVGDGDFSSLEHIKAAKLDFADAEICRNYSKFSEKVKRKLKRYAIKFGLRKDKSVIPQFKRNHEQLFIHDNEFLNRNLESFCEFPPIFAANGKEGILSEDRQADYPEFFKESSDYNFISYLKIK